MLLEEREKEIGRPLTEQDPLFVNYRNQPITTHRIQEQLRNHRGNAPVLHPEDIKTHEIGRDCFITLFALHHIGPTNAKGKSLPAEFCTGHTIDDLKYNKAAWTTNGERELREIFESLRPELNLITHRGSETQLLTPERQEMDEIKNLLDSVLAALLPATAQMTQRERIDRAKQLLLSKPSELADDQRRVASQS